MIIGGLQKFSLINFPGKSAAVIFTKGCNFRCPFCHNQGLIDPDNSWPIIPLDTVIQFLETRRGDLDGVVISGGEPTLQKDLSAVIAKIRLMGFLIKLDTNGSQPAILAQLLADKLIDFIAMDIKAPLAQYEKLAGVSIDHTAIATSIAEIRSAGIPYLFRTTWDKSRLTDENMSEIREMLRAEDPYIVQHCVDREST